MAIKSAKDLYKDRDKLASQSRIRSARDRVSEEDLKKFYDTVQGNINYWMDVGNSFVDSTNSYYKNLDTSSYGLNSSNLWKNSATARNNWLTKEADNIDKILTEYGRYFDSDWISSVRSAMSNVKNASSSILKQADKDIEYWQSWDEVAKKSGMTAEEAYKNSYFTNKYKDYSYEDVNKTIESLLKDGGGKPGEAEWLAKNSDSFMSSAEAQAEMDALNEKYKFGNENWLESTWGNIVNTFDKTWNGEQSARARYQELQTIKSNAERKEKLSQMVSDARADTAYGDYVSQGKAWGLQYTVVEKEEEGYSWTEKVYNDALVGDRSGDGFSVKLGNFVKHMTDEEYNDYLYLLGKYGKDTAQEYLDLKEVEVNTKEAYDIRERLDNPVARHLQLPQIFSLYAGLDQFGSGIKGLFSDGYEAPSEYQIAQGLIREDQNAGGKIAMDLGQTTGNMLPSILASAIATYALGPGGGATVFGATTAKAVGGAIGTFGVMMPSAAGNARQEMLNLGYSEAQANTYGALTGISEASLQYLLGGIGKLGSGLTDDAIKSFANGFNSAGAKFAIEFGADIAGEALEEALQEVLDPFFKSFATGQKFEGIDWGQVAYSGFLGALSAGMLNGMGEVGTRANELSIAKGIKGNENKINAFKEIASKQSVSNLAQKLASKIDTNTGAWKIADLIHEMNGTLSEQNVADIKYQLERSGVLPKDAQTIAEYLGKAVDGDLLTAKQRKALDTNPTISRVFKKVVLDQNSTVNQRLNALMDIYGQSGHAGVDYSAIAKSQSNEGLSKSATFHQFVEGAKKESIKTQYNIGRPTYGNYDATLDAMVNKTKEAKANAKINEGGVTTNAKTGKQISINRVTETDGKTATYALADGTTISNKDAEYADNDEGLLYEGAISLGYDTNTTNAIIHGIKGVDLPVGRYLNGIDEAIEYGRIGYPIDKISTEGFFAELPKSMQTYAYNLGKESAKADVEKAQAKIDANKGKATETRKGEVVKLYEKSGLTPRQEASIDTLGKVVSDITHNKVYIFDTVEKVINGKKVRVFAKDTAGFKAGTPADNGFINKATGEIYIDLHAGMNGEGVILWTLAHELTHFVRQWSPAKFNVLADFLMAEYGKQGVDVQTLIDNKVANSRNKLTRDQAYEEVVADAMQTMFTDTDLASKLERLKNKDKGLWNKIKQFFADLYKRVKGEYKNVSAQTEEAQKVREMGIKAIERISDLFADAVVDAGNTYANLDIEAVASGEVDIDGNKSTHAMSIRSMVEGVGLSFEYDEKTGQMRVLDMYEGTEVTSVTKDQVKDSPLGNIVSLAKQNGFITDAEANKQYGFLADLVNLCLNYKENFTMVWEIAGTQVFSAIKANSDTQYGKTIDFSTVCKKTQQVINVISETQKRLKRGLTKDEIKNIVYYETGKAGEPTPCPVCYVFSRWMGIGGILQQMSDFQKKYEGATEEDMRNFINDVESEIVKHANTPNKKGEVKKAFFDKNGKVKFGSVIADLKSKANSKIKSANIRLKIQETETLLAKADLKDKAKLQKTLNRLNAKLAKEGDILDARLKEAEALMSRYEEYQWLTKTYMDEVKAEDGSHVGWKRDENFKPVDEDVLWDLREGARFATEFPKSWLYRTTKGCNAGKAILPYSDARVGETIQGVAYADVKDILTGEHNAFLNGDVKAQADYMTKAIKKQLAQNLIGGMRYQSTSDFRYEYGSDYLITFLEMQAIGAKVQLYTKVIEAVDFLCTVGAEVNLSVMPLNDGYIELEDGRKQLVFSSVTGINAEAAIAKTKQYDNAQLILVGISDEHIRLALEGDDVNGDVVTFVIPFHGSGNTVKAIQELMDLLGEDLDVTKAQDYSLVQTDHFAKNRTAEQIALWELRKKIISRTYKKGDKSVAWDGVLTTAEEALLNGPNGSKYLKDLYNRFYVDKSADEYGVSLSTAQAEQIFPYEYWDKSLTYAEADMNGERFKDYCATMGIVPRFSGVDSSGKTLGYGDFTNNKGYWKLLIDRKMYNNDGTYHSPKQINVTNFKAETLNPAWGSATYGDVMQKDTNPKKTNAITENVIRQIEGKATDNTMFSARNFSYNELTARGDLVGFVIGNKVQVPLNADGSIDGKAIINSVHKRCKTVQTKATAPTYYLDVPDIDRKVEIIDNSITHGFFKGTIKTPSPKKLLNAKISLALPEILANSIEVNRSQRGGNLDILYSHIMMGTVGIEDALGNTEYYAVRSVIEERKNLNPILVEAEVLGKLHAVNAKKIGLPNLRVVKNNVALGHNTAYFGYSVAQFLQDVKGEFDDTFSQDVYNTLSAQRRKTPFSDNLLFSERNNEYLNLAKNPEANEARLRELVEEAAKEAGYTIKAYHGTRQMGFTVFDPKYSDDKLTLFFTDNPKVAKTYASDNAKVKTIDSIKQADKFKYERGKKYTEDEMREAHEFVQRYYHVYGIPSFNVEKQTMYHAGTRYSAKQILNLAERLARTGLYEVYVNPDEMMVVDAKNAGWSQLVDPDVVEYKYKINSKKEGFNFFEAKANDEFTLELYKNGVLEYNGDITFSEMIPMLRERLGFSRAEMAVRNATDGSGYGSKDFARATSDNKGSYAKQGAFTTREMAAKAKARGYKGLIVKNVYDNGGQWKPYMGHETSNLYVLFDSNQVKSADLVTYDAEGNIIPLSERFNSENNDIRFSERTDNAIDNRSLLANALESVAQNDVEKSWLAKYKTQIADLNEKQNKLAEIRAEIQKTRFTKGADRSKLTELENNAKTLANQINKADKKLLELEASKALKGVVERERAKAYQLGKAKVDEYRKDRAESTARSYYRPRIEKVVSDLRNRLEHPSAKNAIPEAFGASVAKVLSAFNFTTYDKDGNPKPSKANMSRAESQMALVELANQLSQNSLESQYGQLDIPPEMLEWIKEMTTYFEAASNLASGEFTINKMNEVQLKNIYKFLRSLHTTINKAGKYYTNASYDVASDATSTIEHLAPLPSQTNERGQLLSKMLAWDLASPVTVFDRFGEGGKHVYNMLIKGQSKEAYNVQKILDFVDEAYTAKEAKEWRETLVPITIDGKEYKVTIAYLMGLHCLLKQEDSKRHILEGGGIRFGDVKHKGKTTRFADTFFKEADAIEVENILDKYPRAREVAEAMQKFMEETGSDWGNEVSMIRFGYHAFTIKGYYPIRTIAAGSEYEAQQKRANIYALLNKSFTKERTPGANNVIIVDDIFSVFNNHMSEMALYNAWAMPVIDAIKWFNYRESQDVLVEKSEKSVHESLRLAYGNNADEYVRRLFESINGQKGGGLSEALASYMLRKVNRVAVAGNLRVAIQQPFSVVRAYELINAKYVTPLLGKARDVAYEEMLANSGIAKWKSMGYYDVNVSMPLESKVFKNETLSDKATDKLMKAAEDGDAFTWTMLWNACKKETKEKNPKLEGEELLKKTAERFDDLVLRTQVVDSVLAKSQWMRSSGFFHKSSSSFMSEPLTSYNALLRQYDKYSRDLAIHGAKYATKNNIKSIGKAMSIYVLAQVVNAIATAPLDAMRDDDDYETYLEKLLAHFKDNAVSNLMPWNMLPWISDIADYFIYGSLDRPDLALATNVIDFAKSIDKTINNYSYYKLHNTFKQGLEVGSQISGLPVSNLWRDAVSIWNTVVALFGYGELKFQTQADKASVAYKKMYEALFNGNEDRAESLYGQLMSNGVEEDDIYNGLVKVVRDKYKKGDVSAEEAIERMMTLISFTGKTDSDGKPITENDVYWQVDKWSYTNENGGNSEGYSKYDDIFTAMENGDPTSAVEWHIEDKTKVYLEEARREAEKDGKTFNEVKAKKEAEKKAESAVKSAVTSYWKPKYKEAYKNGDTEEMKRIRYMLKATKLYGTTSDLLDTIKGWLKD